MKFTEDWLRDHLQSAADLPEITAKLTAIGLEVEGVQDLSAKLAPFVIAEVVEARPHPNADRLQICLVNYGGGESVEPVEVVCGAPNARTGMRGVFAPVGSDIPGTGLHLKRGEIRGVVSNGMLCSERELLISDEHDGIIDLPEDAPIGESYATWAGLSQTVIEINITPNRGDCLSVRGIARDLAASGIGRLKPLKLPNVKGEFASPINWQLDKNLPDDACPYVIGRSFTNIKNTESPEWLKQKLQAIGLRPISALVDITNYITFDLGRPLHVFDADKLHGATLTMRAAFEGEEILALNGKSYELQKGMTVIADAKGVCAIGGIMGGELSGCDESTTSVFMEAALFSANRTATTGRALSIESDARYRFERGVDAAFIHDGLAIASQMILDICGGQAGEVSSAGALPENHRRITLPFERMRKFAGVDMKQTQAVEILQNLGFKAETSGDNIIAEPPSWRPDIEGAHCLIEEILRIYGFDNIKAESLPRASLSVRATDTSQNRSQLMAQALSMRGYYESVSWSFTSAEQAALFSPADSQEVLLSNPISSQLTHMRPSVLANLTLQAAENRNRGTGDVALFEIGAVFHGVDAEQQFTHISGLRIGNFAPPNWHEAPRLADLFDVKADVLSALEAAQVPVGNLQVQETGLPPYYHPGKSASLNLGNQALAHFGELHPKCARLLELKEGAAIFEIYLHKLPPLKDKATRTRPAFKPSSLQAVMRDFAFLADESIPAEAIIAAIKSADKKFIAQVYLFDVYSDADMQGKRSLAVRVALQSYDKTLVDEDIEKISQAIISSVVKKTGAQLRQ